MVLGQVPSRDLSQHHTVLCLEVQGCTIQYCSTCLQSSSGMVSVETCPSTIQYCSLLSVVYCSVLSAVYLFAQQLRHSLCWDLSQHRVQLQTHLLEVCLLQRLLRHELATRRGRERQGAPRKERIRTRRLQGARWRLSTSTVLRQESLSACAWRDPTLPCTLQ